MNRIYCVSNGIMLALDASVSKGGFTTLLDFRNIVLQSEAVFFKNKYGEWEYLKSRYSDPSDSFITYEEMKNDVISNYDITSHEFKIRKINKKNLQLFFGARFSVSPEGNDTINRILERIERKNNVN